ncbi:2-oxoisovalerate dehydrogenase subunit alpha 1, mitochondrial-like [Cucurbita pepo subsp. pepo]|uniref:2-oxoisovalerate dehydrogenase subunit alpha 1, mitochondrial-like n=1 Tax=Cucurbita pepo subsp. pepo TaxID=3664 RepID=UPI000C9D5209|nr:2-oxoisovalerate dehydrogenase subunit alpha 1, mitochondrial-like [Cucurbita pepo subsp. pepo]
MIRTSLRLLTPNFPSPPPLLGGARRQNAFVLLSSSNRSALLSPTRRFESTEAARLHEDENDDQELDFPGGRVPFTSEMKFITESTEKRVSCYRILHENGETITPTNFKQLSKDVMMKMYKDMITLETMDTIFFEAQRQGRISFYLTSAGEEAVTIASAAALHSDDVVLAQYREPGVLLWRGFGLQEFADQVFGNRSDYGKGRQMPIHYGSNLLNYFTISSPIGTQLPHAVGVAYSLKIDRKDACAVTYFGDGSTSEGDFHAALNFAAVLGAPVVFICRNNGWAISTAIQEQFRSDGVVVKGQAYGVRSIRIDGNDALAVYTATRRAREMAVAEQMPVLIEALTYRVGHHSTSDDSTKYRGVDEIEYWKTKRSPMYRFARWLRNNGWLSEEDESMHRSTVKKQLLQAIQKAEKAEKAPVSALFSDVYDHIPSNLHEQEQVLRQTMKRYPQDYPSDVPL